VITALLTLIKGKSTGLYDFEKSAIEQVTVHLGGAGHQLRRQFEVVNKVQRIASGKEVNLYCMRAGRPAFDDRIRFVGIEEALLATVYFQDDLRGKERLKLELWIANGRLFSLIYGKPPREYFGGVRLRDVRPRITNIEIHFYPKAS
jgi:hypothetical protein